MNFPVFIRSATKNEGGRGLRVLKTHFKVAGCVCVNIGKKFHSDLMLSLKLFCDFSHFNAMFHCNRPIPPYGGAVVARGQYEDFGIRLGVFEDSLKRETVCPRAAEATLKNEGTDPLNNLWTPLTFDRGVRSTSGLRQKFSFFMLFLTMYHMMGVAI